MITNIQVQLKQSDYKRWMQKKIVLDSAHFIDIMDIMYL